VNRKKMGKKPLHAAVCENNLIKIKILIANGCNPNAHNKQANTPLNLATSPECVKYLLASGADPNRQNKRGETPLHLYNNLECIHLLLESGADPNLQNIDGNGPLHCHQNPDIVRMLLRAGADHTLRNHSGFTPISGVHGYWRALIFVQAGADPRRQNGFGQTLDELCAGTVLEGPMKEAKMQYMLRSLRSLCVYRFGDTRTVRRRTLLRLPPHLLDEVRGQIRDNVLNNKLYRDSQ
jgi:ankyrin repeat protein